MGELARRPDAPKLAETPLELITPRPGEGFSLFDKLLWPVAGGLGALGTTLIRNSILSRPLWSGIHVHILAAGVGAYAATWLRDVRFAARAESDAVIRHYISLHPDDFPPFERKRWSEVYKPFKPCR